MKDFNWYFSKAKHNKCEFTLGSETKDIKTNWFYRYFSSQQIHS